MDTIEINPPKHTGSNVKKLPDNLFDLLLERHRQMLQESGIMKKVAEQMDQYTQFCRPHPDDLAGEHRWTEDDIGKTFVGFEIPDSRARGIVFEVELVALFGPSAASFEVKEAFDLTIDGEGDHIFWCFGPFPEGTKFEIDGKAPLTEEILDRVWGMLGDHESEDRFRLYLAIQDWALQPKKHYLQ